MNGSHSITEQIGACPQWHLGERPNSQYWKEQVFIYNILLWGLWEHFSSEPTFPMRTNTSPVPQKAISQKRQKFPMFLSFFKDFIYLFLERGERREKERERNISVWLPLIHPLLGTWPTTQDCALTGNQTGDPLVLRPALNPLSHTSQDPPCSYFKPAVQKFSSPSGRYQSRILTHQLSSSGTGVHCHQSLC